MTTRWPYWANIITFDKDLGNEFAAKIDPDDGSATFGAIRLRRVGDNTPAWATSVPLTPAGKLIFDEFHGSGPYGNLALLGLPEEKVLAAKAAFLIEYGDRADYEDGLPAMIVGHGFAVNRST